MVDSNKTFDELKQLGTEFLQAAMDPDKFSTAMRVERVHAARNNYFNALQKTDTNK